MAGGSGKHGRNKRKPSHQRYTNERRWEKNKRNRIRKLVNKFMRKIKFKINGEWEEISPS